MKMYRCRICGETYLGSEAPSQCPFCGAHKEHLIDTVDFPTDINDIQPTEVEIADLEASIELETANTRFYLAMGTHKENAPLSSAYKRLAKIEAEHCELFCNLANRAEPDDLMTPVEQTTGSWKTDIEESLAREQRASRLYAEFAARATNPRLKEVWEAVSAVEADHIDLDNVALTLAD
jgi:rubrerythrin